MSPAFSTTLSPSQSETMSSTDFSTKSDSNTLSNSTPFSLVASKDKNKTELTSKISKLNSHSHSCWAKNSLDSPSSKCTKTDSQMINSLNSNFSSSNSSSNCNNSSSSSNRNMKKRSKDQLLLQFNSNKLSLKRLFLISKTMIWMLESKLS